MRRNSATWAAKPSAFSAITPTAGFGLATAKRLAKAGMNIARLNLSHGSPADHAARVARDKGIADGGYRLVGNCQAGWAVAASSAAASSVLYMRFIGVSLETWNG